MPEDPIYVGYQCLWEQRIIPNRQVWHCQVRRRAKGGEWKTVHTSEWEGVMMDLADTMNGECMTAFLYGEIRDLARAAAKVHKAARRHRREHERLGF